MKDYLELLSSVGKLKKFQKNSILFYEGEEAKKFFILLKGKIRIYKSTASDKEITLHYFNPPNFIAEMPAFKKLNYPANAAFEEDGEILEIDFINFQNLCSENKEFNFLLISSLFDKIKILEKKLSQNALDLRTRLLKYLLENEKNLDTISQKQIAIDLNVRAQSLSRVLKELKISELIDTKKGRIEILNKDMIMKELW
ncbi:nitrosative stress-sensitive transcriptional regulator NssR [Campylobacter jejuni]|uniref:nitrosative stress-sensitive transcriptional regulator NssR n=1 Tax=Campylobacter jejuni TaxID=197 RepID=UPI001C8C9F40|nr:nitrosative stress-sensitive transcriptional regulator NssR [Campylobacter jejuni]MBX9218134.1 nitrosative stress-sensitive transcriptional regulator NssR [Campylobacter jejuni]HDV8168428.1 nitrosative stress-sensitive transcriptional regulator NssR [Campylobacter jejuni]HED5070849.1 nitrosative stress-sensitive transcriptional regulator NssR [Campylobacter jejuni]HEH5814809.1 nitrosative stress-sensitive transcriptional regulator NssR [Campylobacter jejuni]HEH5824280.1 nitrosative stress-s